MWAISGVLALLVLAHGGRTVQATTSADWPKYLYNNAGTGYNIGETTINSTSASSLKARLSWPAHAGGTISAQAVVANGLVYWGTWDGYEHATPATGSSSTSTWNTFLGQTSAAGCNPQVAGVASTAAVANGTIPNHTSVLYVGGGGNVGSVAGGQAQLYALDATTGAVIWHTPLGSAPQNFIWSSPAYSNGSVYVGVASFGDCPLVQGKFVQLDAATGQIQHTFNVVPNGCTGGSVWSSPVIDAAAGTVYFTTGNAGSCGSTEQYAVSIIKLHTSDLSLVGYWQVPASQQGPDSDFGAAPTLFTGTDTGGVTHQLIGAQNKNGTYYAFDRGSLRANGAVGPLWQQKVANGGDCPQCGAGGISPSAFDGTTLYVASGGTTINGKTHKGSVRALNPGTGQPKWQHGLDSGAVLGAVSGADGVAVVGQGNAIIMVRTSDGQTVFRGYTTSSGAIFYGPATLADGVLYEGDTVGNLYAYSPNGV